jgi:tetratricopeptide (TPR) repeat protein
VIFSVPHFWSTRGSSLFSLGQGLVVFLLLASSVTLGQQTPRDPGFRNLQSRAETAARENRLDEAARLYARALGLRPGWAEGWWSLGTLEYDRDHYLPAAYAFQQLLRLQPSNGTAHAMLGLCQFESGKDDLALKNLLAAERFGVLDREDLRRVALYHLGILQLRARRFGDAQQTLAVLAKKKIRTKELILALGQAALLVNPQRSPPENSEATNVIEQVGRAEALGATSEFEEGKQIYTALTARYPAYPNLHFAFGRFLLESHETDEAVAEFERELDRDPKNVNSMLEIASVRYQVDSLAGLKYAEQAVKLAPQMPFAHYLLGMLRLDTGDAAGAIPDLEFARQAFPDQPKIYFSLGAAYARVGRKTDAAKARAEFLRLDKEASAPGANVYGERPPGISEGELGAQRGENPQQ